MKSEIKGNIFSNLPSQVLDHELTEILLQGQNFKLERIISTGQVTSNDEWYDQQQDEWVVLLKGNAKLLFDDSQEMNLKPGDYVFIPAHKKHRVSWTDTQESCVWLALHATAI